MKRKVILSCYRLDTIELLPSVHTYKSGCYMNNILWQDYDFQIAWLYGCISINIQVDAEKEMKNQRYWV